MVRRLRSIIALLVTVLLLSSCSPATRTPGAEVTASPSPTQTQSPTPTPTPEPTDPPDPLGNGPVNTLLVGTDSRDPQSLTGNADTIMLMHVPADRSQVYLISFTRDTWVDIPGIGQGKINSAFSRGGTDTLKATISGLLGGVEIDYAMQSNFAGFIALTRWLDGFEVDNKYPTTVTVNSTGRVVTFPEGPVLLENTDGLIYVRERKRLPLGDLDRTERHRAAVIGMMDRIKERLAEDPDGFAELINNLHQNVKVTGDFTLDDFLGLVPMLEEFTRDDVVSLMSPITGFGNMGGQSVNLIDEGQTAALGEALRNDTMATYVETYGTDYAP